MAALMTATIRELTDRQEYADNLQDEFDCTRQLEDSALLRDSAGEDLRAIELLNQPSRRPGGIQI